MAKNRRGNGRGEYREDSGKQRTIDQRRVNQYSSLLAEREWGERFNSRLPTVGTGVWERGKGLGRKN